MGFKVSIRGVYKGLLNPSGEPMQLHRALKAQSDES